MQIVCFRQFCLTQQQQRQQQSLVRLESIVLFELVPGFQSLVHIKMHINRALWSRIKDEFHVITIAMLHAYKRTCMAHMHNMYTGQPKIWLKKSGRFFWFRNNKYINHEIALQKYIINRLINSSKLKMVRLFTENRMFEWAKWEKITTNLNTNESKKNPYE